MKKTVRIVLLVLAFFVPTFIAIAAFTIAQSAPVSVHAVKKMVIETPTGRSYTFDKGTPAGGDIDGTMISFFMGINSKASEVSMLPDSVSKTSPCTVTYHSYGKETVYKYYFSTDPEYTYYEDNSGKAYRIATEQAAKFIASNYGRYLYPESDQPVLTISDEKVVPKTVEWNYLCYGDEYRSTELEKTDDVGTFTTSGGIGLTFDKEPDYILATIKDKDGEILFDGSPKDIDNNVLFGSNTTYSVSVVAKWYENAEKKCYGEAEYDFSLIVKAPAVFYLNESSVEPGQFVVVTAKNVEDSTKITFTSTPDINFTPHFFTEGDIVYALIPISYDLEKTDKYEFTLTYGETVQPMTLNIEDKVFKNKKLDISASLIQTYYTTASVAEFDELMNNNFGQSSDTLYWLADSKLREPVSDKLVRAGLGMKITLENGGITYRHPGVDYEVTEGDTVCASLKGKVVYVGELTLTGKTIIIDHGGGLRSVYSHLGTVDVNAGTVVEKGRTIGTVGSSGFCDGAAMHFGLYIYNVPVSPYDMEENGIKLSEIK